MTWSSFKNSSPFTSTPKRHIFATEFTRIQIGTCGVYYNILRYLSTHDATDTSNILLRIRTVCPNSNRLPWNAMKHSKRHTPDSFSKKMNIDQLRTIMIICHWNILLWPQIFESAWDTDTTVTNGLPEDARILTHISSVCHVCKSMTLRNVGILQYSNSNNYEHSLRSRIWVEMLILFLKFSLHILEHEHVLCIIGWLCFWDV